MNAIRPQTAAIIVYVEAVVALAKAIGPTLTVQMLRKSADRIEENQASQKETKS